MSKSWPAGRWKGAIVASALAAIVIYLFFLTQVYFKQQSLLYYPPPKGNEFSVHIQRQDIQLGGWISEGDHPDAALVVFGGNAMALSHDRQSMLRRCTDRTLILFPYRGFEGQAGSP